MNFKSRATLKVALYAFCSALVLSGAGLAWGQHSPDGTQFVEFGKLRRQWLGPLAFLPGGQVAVSTGNYGDTRNALLLSDPKQRSWRRVPLSGFPTSLALIRGNILAVASQEKAVQLWDLEQRKVVRTLVHANNIRSVFGDPQSDLLVTHSEDYGSINGFTLWDARKGTQIRRILTGAASLKRLGVAGYALPRVAASCRRQIVAVGDYKESVAGLWSLVTGEKLRELGRSKERVMALAFSPDGNLLASALTDGSLLLWDTETGIQKTLQPPLPSPDNDDLSRGLAFSPDGTFLVSCSSTTLVWRVETGRVSRSIPVDASGAAFSSDGKTLGVIGFREIKRQPRRTADQSSLSLWRMSPLTRAEAIEAATSELVKNGLAAQDYRVSVANEPERWLIWFDYKVYAFPGSRHLVYVEKDSGKATFMRGM